MVTEPIFFTTIFKFKILHFQLENKPQVADKNVEINFCYFIVLYIWLVVSLLIHLLNKLLRENISKIGMITYPPF